MASNHHGASNMPIHQMWIYNSPIVGEECFIVCIYILREHYAASRFSQLGIVDIERTTGLKGERLVQLKISIRNEEDAIIDQLRGCFDVVNDLRIGFLNGAKDFVPILRLMDGVAVKNLTNHSMCHEQSARLVNALTMRRNGSISNTQ